MLDGRQGMLIGCFIAFEATLSLFFWADNVSRSEGKNTFSVAEVFDSSKPTSDERAVAAGLAACQQVIIWAPGFFLPSLSNQTKWNGAICGFRSGNGSACSIPRCQRVETRENSYRTFVHFPIATQAARETAQPMIQFLTSPGKRVRKLPLLFFSSKGSQCETLAWSGLKRNSKSCWVAARHSSQRSRSSQRWYTLIPCLPSHSGASATAPSKILSCIPSPPIQDRITSLGRLLTRKSNMRKVFNACLCLLI